jgi:mRNA-degrading endonuclease YafQ of YafQ-DinJ toxin-antitoxin module
MEVSFSDSFKKVFRKKVKSTEIEREFWIRLELFINDPFDSKLKTHKL